MPKKIYSEEEARERKNARQREYAKKTGFKANNDYNKKAYTQIIVREKKEVADAYKAKCKELNIPYSQPLHEAVMKILGISK